MLKLYKEHSGPPLFRYLSQEERERLYAHAETYKFSAGENIIYDRDSEAILYLIESGRVEVVTSRGAEGIRLAVLSAGETIGEMSFFTGERRSADVIALEDSSIRFFEPERLGRFLQQDAELAARLMLALCQIMAERVSAQNQKVIEVVTQELPQNACLRIKHPSAGWARDMFFHAEQEVKDIPSGIEIFFPFLESKELTSKILRLGPDCEVLMPKELRDQVATAAQRIVETYR